MLTLSGEGGVSNMLTNFNKGGGEVKAMLMLARGFEHRYRKPQFFKTKFAFQGVILLFSIMYSSGKVSTVKKSKWYFEPGSHFP